MTRLILITLVIIVSFHASGQSPRSFNYQAIARDVSGNPLTNQGITVQINIIEKQIDGSIVYQETHPLTTNQFGLFTLAIGALNSSSFSTIKWGQADHFIQVLLDTDGGANNFIDLGTFQLLSVPYAFFATNAGSAAEVNIRGNHLDVLSWNDDSVKWVSRTLLDNDSTNELQTININEDTIFLSQGGYVILDSKLLEDNDSDSTNELQTISLSGDTILLNNGGYIRLTTLIEDGDKDSTNELQTLSYNNDTLTLSNGGSIPIKEDNLGDHSMNQNLSTNDHWISNDGDIEGLYVDNSGNVGINKTPSSTLDVNGNIGINGNEVINSNGEWVGSIPPSAGIPTGSIMMWYGSINSIPAGWALCDGTNDTPDLRGRFIVGYDSGDTEYDTVGKAGGEKQVTLTIDQMPEHSHGNKVHTNGFNSYTAKNTYPTGRNYASSAYRELRNTSSNYTNYNEIVEAGGSQSHENRPPFFTLAYIMKL